MIIIQAQLKVYDNYINAYLDRDFGEYYRKLIPPAYYVQPQKYKTHITVVRKFEGWKNKDGRFDNASVTIYYKPLVYFEPPYYFLKCWSDDIGEIRVSLGLPEYREGYTNYHITVGNIKK
jgi:hypothetical protein